MIRAATTLANPCTGAQRRDFLLGMRRGQLAGAHVPSWCSRHGVDAGCSQRAGPPGELTTCAYQTLAEGTGVDAGCSQRAGPPGELTTCAYQTLAEGTGVDAPRRPQRARVGVLEPTPGGVHEPG